MGGVGGSKVRPVPHCVSVRDLNQQPLGARLPNRSNLRLPRSLFHLFNSRSFSVLLRRRTANLQKGRQLLREGKVSEARECFTRSVSITPAMAHRLIKVMVVGAGNTPERWFTPVKACTRPTASLSCPTQAARARGVDCLVAPYEADAQLAYLTKVDLAQAVITEDSDLLAFGCRKVPPALAGLN